MDLDQPLEDLLELTLTCPACCRRWRERVSGLLGDEVPCPSCGSPIELSSPAWRASLDALLRTLHRTRPVGGKSP